MIVYVEESDSQLTLRRPRRPVVNRLARKTALASCWLSMAIGAMPLLRWASTWVDSIELLGFILVPSFIAHAAMALLPYLGELPFLWRSPFLCFDRDANELRDVKHALCPLLIGRARAAADAGGQALLVDSGRRPSLLIRQEPGSESACEVVFISGTYAPVPLGVFDDYKGAYELSHAVAVHVDGNVYRGALGTAAVPQ